MKQSKCISAATVAAWVGLALAMGCDDSVSEPESAVQTGDLRPRRDAGTPGNPPSAEDAGACTAPVAQCRSDGDCPVTLICRLCPDGSCADPNVHCVDGQCSAPNYTCPATPDAGPQCRSDLDCPVTALCKLCPDGSCADPNVHCVDGQCSAPDYTCPSAPGGTPCASSQQCAADQYCTVEDGVCNPPPGCGPRGGCIALCYGTCERRAACGSAEQALEDFVNANKACRTTDDCQVLYAGCGLSFEDGCTGGVYVNQSIDAARFNALSAAFTECKGRDCAACERATLPPTCIAGLCQRQAL